MPTARRGPRCGPRFDPRYTSIRKAVKSNVDTYHRHTKAVQTFIESHDIVFKPRGRSTWDTAPFEVLIRRRGKVVPNNILVALSAAIEGRELVSDRFTVDSLDVQTLYDDADVDHRVFVEKLRTCRRVWFPKQAAGNGDERRKQNQAPQVVINGPFKTSISRTNDHRSQMKVAFGK
jgi:hypothetical protein